MNIQTRKVFTKFDDLEAIIPELIEEGIVLIDGLTSLGDLVWLSSQIGNVIKHRDSGLDGIITLRPTNDVKGETFKGYTRKEQYPHTDGTMVDNPADIVILYCEMPASVGGESTFVDAKKLYEKINKEDQKLLHALKQKDAGIFGDPGEAVLVKPVFKACARNRISICFRNDKLVEYSSEIQKKFDYLTATIDSLTTKIKLKSGQGYIINNTRFIHGRKSFEGDRIIHRVQIHAHRSSNVPSGFNIV